MSDAPLWSDEEISLYCARIGLGGLDAAGMARLRENADKVSATGRALPRMTRKDDEPAVRLLVPVDGAMSAGRPARG